MSKFEFAIPTLFGLEGICGDELRRLDMENVRVENGRVLFAGDETALARAILNIRTGERLLIVLADLKPRPLNSCSKAFIRPIWRTISPRTASSP